MIMDIIVRDDDTSFFTQPAMLERVYRRVWEQHLPVSLAVIPAHYGAVLIPSANGQQAATYDWNIPPQFRGQPAHFPVSENAELCAVLTQWEREGLIEICLHGYTHDWMEWTTPDKALLQRKLDDGRSIFDRAFPGADIRTFITPYDRVSDEGFDVILKAELNVCIDTVNVPAAYGPLKANHKYRQSSGNAIFVGRIDHPAGHMWDKREIDRAAIWDAAIQAADAQTALYVVNHCWTYYDNWAEPDEQGITQWERAFSEILLPHHAHITTFKAAASR